jgi:hypothetical protein
MAHPEQLLFGTYVGLVLETQDPDGLGRVKLIVPGKIGPLYKGWNDKLDDITFSKNVDAEVLERLLAVLPWARPSTPLWGGGTGSPVDSTTNSPTIVPTDQAITPNASNNTPPASTVSDNRTTEQRGVDNKQGTFGNQQTAVAGDCAGTGGQPLSLAQCKQLSVAANQRMDASNQTIASNNGVMNEASFKAYATQRLQCSPLLSANIDPAEARIYGVNNTHSAEQWADFMWRTALAEQGGRIAASGPDTTNDPGGSWGSWSNSVADTSVYAGYNGKSVNDLQTTSTLAANTAISQVESEVCRNNTISGLDHAVTSRGSYAHTTMQALAGQRGTLSVAKSGALVQRTTSMGVNAMGSTNMSRYGSPIGNFSIPAAGSKVWVIFENGNPSRPVYIGQVYDPANISAHGG